MRFRKRIPITKGVRLNVSKSGVSLTAGVKGISFNLGKDGLFLNASLPGTGLYDRKKIIAAPEGGFFHYLKDKVMPQSPLREAGEANRKGAEDKLSPSHEESIPDQKTQEDELLAAYEESMEAMISIQKASCPIFARDEAVERFLHSADNGNRAEPTKEEGALILQNDPDALSARLERWLSELHVPFEFHLDYELRGEKIYLDLDLPEIEDMIAINLYRNEKGRLSQKNKSQAELRKDYASCVFGLAIFVASHVFDLAPALDSIVLSAYTQRRDRKGRMEDQYIYSIIFDRLHFSELDYSEDPQRNCFRFDNICLPRANGDFGVIEPFPLD